METANYTFITERLSGLVRHEAAPPELADPGQYLLLELAQDPSLLAALYAERETSGWAAEPLFSGTSSQHLASVGPHLVALSVDSRQRAAILDRLPKERLGIVLQPRDGVAWEALVDHCRQHLWGIGADGRPTIIRWFDPHGLRALLTALTPAQRETLTQPFVSLTWHSGHGWYQWASSPGKSASSTERSPVQWDTEFFKRMAQEQLWDRAIDFAVAYRRYLPAPIEMAAKRLFEFLERARTFGVTSQARQERWLRLYLHCGREFWHDPIASQWLNDKSLPLDNALERLESHFFNGAKP
ncbi:DUF4123 domain-containing protein [Pseudomonas gingeri]|uniref:DUF4123 domain-containing protein n=2 Tax=Pseudomonas gingeri TaxID=117681 RepID=UPI0015A4ED56|nr:DUF4123 domain-containing protein [Pseudomonas gingeri]NWD09717.1 DUF4123 domain-containing protein [Pseudomonas gingeri]NWE36895.1 DUF4123 domain-containing protein [Pseudomonas gingeri]NWE61046.1 DUF4123 domain-containing protein [Pseudomonas gingeri]NWF06051.1 DUF4123 domain-containing protein [Pseudomonas gingeri]